jgi:hypothetical protein
VLRYRRATAAAAGFGLVIVLALVAVLAGRPQVPHADGAGVLAAYDAPIREVMGIDVPGNGGQTRYTFGTPLCQAVAGSAPVVRRVGPAATIGTGTTVLGARIRTFTWSEANTPIGSVGGFPPALVEDMLAPVAGYAVGSACDARPGQPFTELLVGLELTGEDGGGWDGILVEYDVGGRAEILRIDRGMFICGPSYPCG